MQAELSGKLPPGYPATLSWRKDSGLIYKNVVLDAVSGVTSPFRQDQSLPAFNVTLDLSGGFYEDGIYGPVKITKSIAMTTSMLAWAILDYPQIMIQKDIRRRVWPCSVR
jgi:hypothetical protein